MCATPKSQVLVLPINNCAFSAGYKNKAYLKQQGYLHYGVDLYSNVGNKTVYACGDGEVVACGWDGVYGNERLGNVIAIVYKNVKVLHDIATATGISHKAGDVIDVACRMFHFDSINVKVGDKVTKDTVIGMYGNTGSTLVGGKRMGKHLHIEFDVDTKWPTLTYGVSKGGTIFNRTEDIKKAGGLADSTINPSFIWSLDYNQNIKGIYDGWYTSDDINLPKYADVVDVEEVAPHTYVAEGIDVSVFNGDVDYKKVKASGIDFVMVRLGWTWYDGGLDIDKNFKKNIEGALNAGLNVGVFVYAYDKSSEAAKIAAGKVIEAIKPYKITYPVAYDIEESKMYQDFTIEEVTNITDSFLSEIQKLGYYSMLYTYVDFANNHLDMNSLRDYDTWIAYYGKKNQSVEEKYNSLNEAFDYAYGIWQYIGNDGICEGVNTACDRDFAYKNYPAIIMEAGLNNLVEAEDSDDILIESLKDEVQVLKGQIASIIIEKEILMSENDSLRKEIQNIKTKIISLGESIGEDGFSI